MSPNTYPTNFQVLSNGRSSFKFCTQLPYNNPRGCLSEKSWKLYFSPVNSVFPHVRTSNNLRCHQTHNRPTSNFLNTFQWPLIIWNFCTTSLLQSIRLFFEKKIFFQKYVSNFVFLDLQFAMPPNTHQT